MGIDYYEARMKVGDLRATFDTLPDVLMALFQQGEFLTSSAWISADSDKWHDAEGVVAGEDERGAVILTDAWVSAPASAVLDRLRLTCAESGALKHGFERLVDSNVQAEIEYAASQRRDPPRPAGRARRILADRSGDAPDVEPEVLKRQREEWEQRRDEWRRRHDEWQEEYVAGVKQRFSSYEYSDYVNDLRTTIHGGEVVDYPTWPLDNVERPEVWEMRSPLDYEELLLDWFVVVAREAADLPISISAIELIDEDFDLLSILKQEYSQRSADRELFSRAPLIVLTEGSSDADAIDAAIDLLRPDIRDFVAFLDYRQDKVAGGAPELVKGSRPFSGRI